MSGDETGPGGSGGRDRTQLAVVVLAILAVFAAALVSPAAAGGTNPSGPEINISKWFDSEENGDFPPEEGCAVELRGRPVPGTTVTVRVWYDAQPAPDSRVWFNGEFVGRTDRFGEVEAEVPFERQLRIRVDPPEGEGCVFRQETESSAALGGIAGAPADGVALPTGRAHQVTPPGNENNYSVEGRPAVVVKGPPVPGEAVTVIGVMRAGTFTASTMSNATVRVDGQTVGRTDTRGAYNLSVPVGVDSLDVEITKGEFTAERTVRVLSLSVGVRPASQLFPLPGGDATVRVSRGRYPVEDATVSVDGRSVGETNATGQVAVALPSDPTATVTAEVDGERARTPVALVYLRSGVFVGFLLVPLGLTFGLGYHTRGWRGVGYAAAGWLCVGFVAGSTVLWGRRGFLASLGTVAVLAVAVVVLRNRTTVGTGGATLGQRLLALVSWLANAVLSVTLRLSVVTDLLRSAVAGLWDLLRGATSVRGLLTGLVATLRGVPARVRQSRRLQVLLALCLWAVLVVVGYALAGWTGALAALALGAVVGVPVALWLWSPLDAGAADPPRATENTGRANEETNGARWLRRVWRAFARRVFPGEWQTKTPGEVSRAAVERGFPEEPVERLTDAFRAVEYGDRPLSESRERLVAAAVDRLSPTDEEGDQ